MSLAWCEHACVLAPECHFLKVLFSMNFLDKKRVLWLSEVGAGPVPAHYPQGQMFCLVICTFVHDQILPFGQVGLAQGLPLLRMATAQHGVLCNFVVEFLLCQ